MSAGHAFPDGNEGKPSIDDCSVGQADMQAGQGRVPVDVVRDLAITVMQLDERRRGLGVVRHFVDANRAEPVEIGRDSIVVGHGLKLMCLRPRDNRS